MTEKINLEIKKINKNTNVVEWTDTLEIPYENKKISVEEKKEIEREFLNNYNQDQKSKKINNESLLNTKILNMEANPFYQPSMNTFEFAKNDNTVILATITKNDNSKTTFEDEIKALEKLCEMNVITKEELNEKKEILLNKNKQ